MNQPTTLHHHLVNWVQDTRSHAPLLESEADSLLARLAPLQHRHHQLDELAQKPLTLGLYGHSIAGKHHLLSALLANNSGRVEITLGDKSLDYLTHINPGHAPATVAVRFTHQPAPVVEHFPLLLNLFSESDIAQRLIRQYHALPEPRIARSSVIAGRIADLQSRRQARILPGLTSLQVSNIARCYHAQLRRQHHLDDALWQQMADILPWLTTSDRVTLLALLWGDDSDLSKIWAHLADTLHHLGHATQYLAPASLLVDSFLLPAEGFLIPATPDEPEIQADVMICPLFHPAAGSPVSLAQRDLLTLCAEISLTLSHAPKLADVEIIDIPLQQIDYYSDRLQPDTLLVCNTAAQRPEVKIAGKALARWVDHTQGSQSTLPGLIWAITPHDARFTSGTSLDDGVQRLIGLPGKRWGTLQALDNRNMHRLIEWLTDAMSPSRRAQRITLLQTAVDKQTVELFQRYSESHLLSPEVVRQQAEGLVRALQAHAAQHGELLASLVPDRHALQQIWQSHHQQRQKQPADFRLDIDLFAEADDQTLPENSVQSYGAVVHQLWVSHLRHLAQRPEAAPQFGLENSQLQALCDLLVVTGYRLELPTLLDTALQSGDGSMAQEITCVSNVLGDFVNWLGYAHVEPLSRPASRINKGATVFAPTTQARASTRLTQLGETPARGNANYVYDWLVALYARAVENIGYRHPEDVSDLHRVKLRELLEKM